MRIIKATEAIEVQHPVFCWFGQPGICKTSLAYSTRDPLLLDFDAGAHRAVNRRDTLQIQTWADVLELMETKDALAPYATVVVDTVGRCLDVMTTDIITTTPKYGPNGNLSQQGWGVLKSRFRTWTSQLRALGKDVALVAHDREEKDGDTRIVRPDIAGGSYGEVMKVADFVAYLYMAGKDRVLDFNPTDRWVGKNPGGWAPFKVPPAAKAQTFMADLFDQGRAALGTISEASAKIALQVETWRQAIENVTTADECTDALAEIGKIETPMAVAQVKRLLDDRRKALGLTYDGKARKFVAPAAREPGDETPVEAPSAEAIGFGR